MDRTVLIPLGEYLFTVDLPSTFWLSAASGKSSYRHSHAGYEVSCLREGRCGVYLDDELLFLERGDLLLLPPGVPHFTTAEPGCIKDSFLFSFQRGDGAGSERLNAELARLTEACTQVKRYLLLRDMPCGISPGELPESGSELELMARLTDFLAELARRIAPVEAQSSRQSLDRRRANLIETYLDFQSREEGERDELELAALLGVSRRQLNRIVHDLYGLSYRELLNRSRMDAANYFLANTDMSIAQIAQRLGYQTDTGFYLAYQRFFHTSPGAYREAWPKRT